VVYADAAHVLCRRWNWRQDARSIIRPATRRAVVTVQSNGAGDVDAGANDLVNLITKFCGGTFRIAVLDRTRPTADL
jgi:DNA/RNA-binding domain of Phe-tRNA-synthetase-like protein